MEARNAKLQEENAISEGGLWEFLGAKCRHSLKYIPALWTLDSGLWTLVK